MGKVRPKDLENGVASPWANYYYWTNEDWLVWFHLVPWASESTWEAMFTYWENIAEWKLVFFWDWLFKERLSIWYDILDDELIRGWVNIWYDWNTKKYRVKFDVPVWVKNLSTVIVPCWKTWTSNNISARIVTLWWDFVKESQQVLWAQLSENNIVFNFDNVELNDSTYWLEIEASWINTSHYFTLYVSQSSNYYAWNELSKYWYWRYDGSIWQNDNNYQTIVCKFNFSIPTESWKVYECNSKYLDSSIPNWVALETKIKWERWKIMIVWVANKFSNLIPWLQYKLNSDLNTGKRNMNSDRRFNYSATEDKVADIFKCDFDRPIYKVTVPLICSDNTIANWITLKIVTLDSITWMPTDTLADPNAIATIQYSDLANNEWQNVIFKFPWPVVLTPNIKYALVMECDWTLSTTWYITTRYSNNLWDGSMYLRISWIWTFQNAAYSLCYSFWHWDDVVDFQRKNLAHSSYRQYIGSNSSHLYANRFTVSKPTKIKSLTWLSNWNGTPVTNMNIRIETNKELSHINNSNWLKYDWTGWSAYQKDFGSSSSKKVAMKFTTSQAEDIKYLTLYLRKISSPSDKVTVRIETSNNDRPSWVLVSENAQTTSDLSLYTTLNTDFYAMFKFNENIHLDINTEYWIVVSKENDVQSATSYYQISCKNWWTFAGWSLMSTSDWETWETVETWNVKAYFYFNNSNNVSIDAPSGNLVSDWATATYQSSQYVSWMKYETVQFDQEVELIPNTIYWLVWENFRPYPDNNYYWIYTCQNSNWHNSRKLYMPFLTLYLGNTMQWTTDSNGYYPRFWFNCEQFDNWWVIELTQWTYSGKNVTAISETNWILSFWDVGNTLKRNLTAWVRWQTYMFKAPKDWKIQFLKDASWTVRSYVFWSNYTPKATLTGTTAVTVNIEKDLLYHITCSSQDFILSFN